MVDENKTRPIVIKRVKKVEHGHHGGSWKIAFADFMTAMFAIFLVLWLLLALNEKQREGIGQYFRDPSAFQEPASRELIDMEGQRQAPIDLKGMPIGQDWLDTEEMRELAEKFRNAVMNTPELEEYRDQILMDMTEDGLRIQLVDKQGQPMFEAGSAEPAGHTQEILLALAEAFEGVPNPLSISGHTDARPFVREDYDNWFLSADRANEAREVLRRAGLGNERIAQVSGYADTVPFDQDDPRSPINRRISLTLLSQEAVTKISDREGSAEDSFNIDQVPRDLLTPQEKRERERDIGLSPQPQADRGGGQSSPTPSSREGPGGESAGRQPSGSQPQPEQERQTPPRGQLPGNDRPRPEPETW